LEVKKINNIDKFIKANNAQREAWQPTAFCYVADCIINLIKLFTKN